MEKAVSLIHIGPCTLILGRWEDHAEKWATCDILCGDPPYGTNAKVKNRSRARMTKAHDFPAMEGDNRPFDPAPWLKFDKPTILWGANHYAERLPATGSWIVWDKRRDTTPDDGADAEIAWCSLPGVARIFRHLWRGVCREGEENISKGGRKLHPAQKPVALMNYCLDRLKAEPGMTVGDGWMGSGSLAVAALRRGVRYIGTEVNETYYNTAVDRLLAEYL